MTIVEPAATKTKNRQKLPQRNKIIPLLVVIAGAVVVVALTYTLPPFRNYHLATIGAYLCVTAGLTVLTGLNGQLSLGHVALMATGAYTLALWQNKFNLLRPGIVLAVLVTTLAGGVIGLAAARLRGPYLAGLTLAVAVVVPSITSTFDKTFNSDQGLSVALNPPPGVIPVEQWQAWICWAGALIGAVLLVVLPSVAQSIAEDAGSQHLEGNLALTFFGIVLVLVMLAAPGGLASLKIPRINRKQKGQE
jgi:branched-chain amino acid transport system permease protein